MKQSLPWESVPPPIYPAQSSLKPRKKWVQTGGWILVVVLLLFGISTRSRNPLLAFVSLAFSVLYLLTLMTKKDAALTSRGLEIFYNMQFTTNYEFFPWEDINAIVCEDRGHADMVRLHIGHGLVLLYGRILLLFFLFLLCFVSFFLILFYLVINVVFTFIYKQILNLTLNSTYYLVC